jgi:hypothetical protein|tara:strand:- start:448 stop:858 length:411 start_codon:yes stop_codon:yes gene_type:complete
MKISQSRVEKIIQEELSRLLSEGCGCGCGGAPGGCMDKGPEPEMFQTSHSLSQGQLSKEDALDAVEQIAAMTSCPVTREALMSIVNDLSDSYSGEEWNLDDESRESGPSWHGDDTWSHESDAPRLLDMTGIGGGGG